ncbi:hypothetical protein OG400_21350 [Micromonospora ureilytica]|uniref:hypothetical protein n=1 Tax=Micromonospora ureilytica TaxID=709868 RepID=UPI002E0D9FB4|nr:hypothetical protein OG400_21350 [Micromonospora ureilytica]
MKLGEADLAWLAADRAMAAAGDPILAATAAVLRGRTSRWVTCGAAARALVDADSVAPAEVRCRPLARTVIADVARAQPAPAGVARLATLVGATR